MSYAPRTRRGSRAPNAVFTPAQVAAIRQLAAQGYTLAQIKARLELTCCLSTIGNVIHERTYKQAVSENGG